MTAPEIRVRCALQPGSLALESARTALYGFLFARRHGGRLVLRLADLEASGRDPRPGESATLEDLRWLGVRWDEGPDVGGPAGLYRQSERNGRYRLAADRLQSRGHAYLCFCPPEPDQPAGQAPPRHGGRCRDLAPAQVEARLLRGEQPVVRFRVPWGELSFVDLIHGPRSLDAARGDDFVLLRRDGLPSPTFAAVVDDADMRVTHVVTEDDDLPDTPRQVLLHRALGAEPPEYAHLPPLLGPDHHRLPRADALRTVRHFRDEGVLPEAFANFLALLGWSTGDGRELLSLEEMTASFAFVRVGRTPAVVTEEKLHWLNRHYLRNTSASRLWEPAAGFLAEAGFLPRQGLAGQRERLTVILDLLKGGLKSLREIVAFGPLFFRDDPGWGPEARERLATPAARQVLARFRAYLAEGAPPTAESFHAAMRGIQKQLDLGGNVVYPIVRLAVSGLEHGPELDRLLEVLGPELVRRRLDLAGGAP